MARTRKRNAVFFREYDEQEEQTLHRDHLLDHNGGGGEKVNAAERAAPLFAMRKS